MTFTSDVLAKSAPIVQYLAMITGNLCLVSSGTHYGWTSPALPQLFDQDSPIKITNDEGSWLTIVPLLGAVLGSPIGGVFLDLIGRKKVILLLSPGLFVSWIMIYYAKSIVVLLIARFVAGVAEGISFCALPMYLAEISDPKIRGFLGSSVSICWTLGILLINVIGSHTSVQTTALLSSVIPIIFAVTFVWMPESPYYLIMKGDTEGARQNLAILHRNGDVELELERITKAIDEQDNAGKLLDLFTVKSNRRAFYIMIVTVGAQLLCGSSAITFYAYIIFDEATDVISPSLAVILYFSVQVILCGICSVIVDKVGRRPLLIGSIVGAIPALMIEGAYFYLQNETDFDTGKFAWVPIAAMVVFVLSFSFGMQTIPMLLVSEIFPTNVKAFALSFCDIYFCVLATVVSKLFQYTKDAYGLYVPFFIFTGFCVLALIFITALVPETRGKTLEEIQDDLKGRSREKTTMVTEQYVVTKL